MYTFIVHRMCAFQWFMNDSITSYILCFNYNSVLLTYSVSRSCTTEFTVYLMPSQHVTDLLSQSGWQTCV